MQNIVETRSSLSNINTIKDTSTIIRNPFAMGEKDEHQSVVKNNTSQHSQPLCLSMCVCVWGGVTHD